MVDIMDALQIFLAGGFALYTIDRILAIYKKHHQEKILLGLVDTELNANIKVLEYNKKIVNLNNEALEKDKDTADVLIPFQNTFWELILYTGIPHVFFKSGHVKILARIKAIDFIIDQLNEQIKTREHFRINNKGLSTYNIIAKSYNDMILDSMDKLEKILLETEQKVRYLLK